MVAHLQNSRHGNVEEKQDPWVDIHRPIMLRVEDEIIRGGTVGRFDDIFEAKEPEG